MYEVPIQRDYVRTDNWSITAKAGKTDDPDSWFDVRVPNIAAGGALFTTDVVFDIGEKVWLSMEIDPMAPGFVMKIPMKVEAVVRGDRGTKDGLNSYSVEFTMISNNDRIRLDEIIMKTNYQFMLNSESDALSR